MQAKGGMGGPLAPPLGVCLFLSLFAVPRRFSLQPSTSRSSHSRRSSFRLYEVFLSHPVCFPFLFSLQHPLFSSLRKLRGNRQIFGSEPSLRLVWAQNQPNFRPNRQNAGNFAENPCRPGNYPATAWVFCRFLNFASDFAPDQLRLRETREFPEWSTKHPLFSLEISGNAKCWGPSVFLFVFRKTSYRPSFPSLHGTFI